MTRAALAFAALLLAVLLPAAVARADGEAGLVIQEGGSVRTFCVAFQGDGISGEALLNAAGLTFDQFGGGARVLCSLDSVGCFDASSFESCFCECKAGSGRCTYWAFFTQRYATSWVYSTIGFNIVRARDGDLHGWKWGEGGPQSAPVPVSITFEDVCGHPPRGGASAATATPAAVTPVTPTATGAPATAASGTPTGSPAGPGVTPATSTAGDTPTPLVPSVVTPSATVVLTPSAPAAGTPLPTITITVGQSPSGAATVTTDDSGASRDSGGGNSALIAFASVAGILLAAIVGGLAWRARRGH